ncbi:hypothetical protein SprV_0401469300 [Sparganum proliferum]
MSVRLNILVTGYFLVLQLIQRNRNFRFRLGNIEKEKTEVSLRQEIEQGKDLKHVQTQEKTVLPTKQDIEAEKKSS